MLEITSSTASATAALQFIISLQIFFVKGLQADTPCETNDPNCTAGPPESVELHYKDYETQCYYLKKDLAEARKLVSDCETNCRNLKDHVDYVKDQVMLCERDVKKFASLMAIRTRVKYVAKILGKGWDEQEPKDPIEMYNYHRKLWKWILQHENNERVYKLQERINSGGLLPDEFCNAMANVMVTTYSMHNMTIQKVPRFPAEKVLKVLKTLSFNETLFRGMKIIFEDELLRASDLQQSFR